jgi:hypothetical protein
MEEGQPCGNSLRISCLSWQAFSASAHSLARWWRTGYRAENCGREYFFNFFSISTELLAR